MQPGVAFTKAICERAEKEGWELRMSPFGFQWKLKDKEEDEIQDRFPSAKIALHAACVWLDNKLGWNTQVEL